MQNGLGMTVKSSLIFRLQNFVKVLNNYYRKNARKYAEKFRKIKFEICSIYKAQCAEESSLLKFTEQFCKVLFAQLSLRSLLNTPTTQTAYRLESKFYTTP